MALSKDKKQEVVDSTRSLLENSRMTVMAKYSGTSVKAMQQLRRDASENGTTVRVIKNRLFKKAAQDLDQYKSAELGDLQGQVLYAFNDSDEVAPAQVLAAFAKTNPNVEFVLGLSAEGQILSPEDIKALAALPGKDQLIAEVIAQLLSPIHDTTNALAGNLHALLDGVEAKAAA